MRVTESVNSASLERLLEDTKRIVDEFQAGAPADPEAEPPRGEGAAADGRVRAVVGAGGRVESLTVDPRVMRGGTESVCEHIMTAVNEALDNLKATTAAATPAGVADPAALSARLSELRTESLRQMDMITQGISETLDRIGRSTGRGR